MIFIPYLALRRRYRAAAFTALATVTFSLSPTLVFGWSRLSDYVSAWRTAVAEGWGVGSMNQSIFAMWDCFIGHGMVPFNTARLSGIRVDYLS